VAHAGHGELHDPPRQAARVHQLPREQEERDGQQREGVGARDHLLAHDLRVEDAHPGHHHDGAEHEREGDRHAERQPEEQRAEEDEEDHRGVSCASYSPGDPRHLGRETRPVSASAMRPNAMSPIRMPVT
jgi:hypothetical protein